MDAWVFGTEQELDDHRNMLRWYKQFQTMTPTVQRPAPRNEVPEDQLVILLDDLPNQGSVLGSVLEPANGLNQIQTITAYGGPTGGYFRIGFTSSLSPISPPTVWTPFIYPLLDDAAKITTYMTKLNGLKEGDVSVTGGLILTGIPPDTVTYNTWRWQIEFAGQYLGKDLQPVQLDQHLSGAYLLVQSTTLWEDTGRVITVNEAIGVPSPTPLKKGARAWCRWKNRPGWCVVAVEARDFGNIFVGDYGLA